jgi:hypothetical protein
MWLRGGGGLAKGDMNTDQPYIDFRPNTPCSLAMVLGVTRLEADAYGTGQNVVPYRLCC